MYAINLEVSSHDILALAECLLECISVRIVKEDKPALSKNTAAGYVQRHTPVRPERHAGNMLWMLPLTFNRFL